MADEFYITKPCRRCDGTGTFPYRSGGNLDGSCPRCSGTGVDSRTLLDLSDLIDKIDNLQDKVDDIFEKVSEP